MAPKPSTPRIWLGKKAVMEGTWQSPIRRPGSCVDPADPRAQRQKKIHRQGRGRHFLHTISPATFAAVTPNSPRAASRSNCSSPQPIPDMPAQLLHRFSSTARVTEAPTAQAGRRNRGQRSMMSPLRYGPGGFCPRLFRPEARRFEKTVLCGSARGNLVVN